MNEVEVAQENCRQHLQCVSSSTKDGGVDLMIIGRAELLLWKQEMTRGQGEAVNGFESGDKKLTFDVKNVMSSKWRTFASPTVG